MGVAILGVAATRLFERTPCEAVAARLCEFATPSECAAFRQNLPSFAEARCVRAVEGFEAVDAMPPFVRSAGMTRVVEELFEMTPETVEAAKLLEAPMRELDRTGTLSAQAVDAIVAAPPAACLQLIGKMNLSKDTAQQALHGVLVKLNGGTDLGPEGAAWLDWCQARRTTR